MENLKSRINLIFNISLFMSIAMVVGIPGIIFGAIYNIIWLMVISIACVGCGFYVMPLMWIKYADLRSILIVIRFIEEQHYYSVTELTKQTKYSEAEIVSKINYAIKNFYLTSYYFDGKELILNTREKQQKKINSFKCENCGSVITSDTTSGKCEYCGFVYNKDNKEN